MERISRDKTDLGICLIDVYRASGDLNDSWDIVPRVNGGFDRAPDARYGVNQPDGKYKIEDFNPVHLFEIEEVWDKNGHTKRERWIEDGNGRVIANASS